MNILTKKENFYKIPLVFFIIFILIQIKPTSNTSYQFLNNKSEKFSIEEVIKGAPGQFNKIEFITEKKITYKLENKFIKKVYIFDDKINKSTFYVAQTNQGYNGNITYSILINDSNSNLIALKILNHNESRGLNNNLNDENIWQTKIYSKNFNNLKLTDWGLKKNGGAFDSLTGATITQHALLKSISKVLEFHVNEHL